MIVPVELNSVVTDERRLVWYFIEGHGLESRLVAFVGSAQEDPPPGMEGVPRIDPADLRLLVELLDADPRYTP